MQLKFSSESIAPHLYLNLYNNDTFSLPNSHSWSAMRSTAPLKVPIKRKRTLKTGNGQQKTKDKLNPFKISPWNSMEDQDINFHGTFPQNSMEIFSSISVEFPEKVPCNPMETTPSNAMDSGSSMEFTGIRPVSNVALLPCRTHKNLTGNFTAIALQWFQTSNLIQSRRTKFKIKKTSQSGAARRSKYTFP